jgi:hypothetical protein
VDDYTNWAIIDLEDNSLLAKYSAKHEIYKCPSDVTMTTKGPFVRTMSMNAGVGTILWFPKGGKGPGQSVTGDWLDGTYNNIPPTGNPPNGPWKTYGKTGDLNKPSM